MRVADLERLYDYHYWANRRLLDVVAQLSPEQFTQPVAGSYGSIRNTLVHVMSAEWGWLDRCGGPVRGNRLKAEDYATLDSVLRTWTDVEQKVRAFLSGLTDNDMMRSVDFTLGEQKGTASLEHLMLHAVVHAVHHRGQVAMLLRTLGCAPGNFDLLFYDRETA